METSLCSIHIHVFISATCWSVLLICLQKSSQPVTVLASAVSTGLHGDVLETSQIAASVEDVYVLTVEDWCYTVLNWNRISIYHRRYAHRTDCSWTYARACRFFSNFVVPSEEKGDDTIVLLITYPVGVQGVPIKKQPALRLCDFVNCWNKRNWKCDD